MITVTSYLKLNDAKYHLRIFVSYDPVLLFMLYYGTYSNSMPRVGPGPGTSK